MGIIISKAEMIEELVKQGTTIKSKSYQVDGLEELDWIWFDDLGTGVLYGNDGVVLRLSAEVECTLDEGLTDGIAIYCSYDSSIFGADLFTGLHCHYRAMSEDD